ncbi:hypothetical protein KOR34_01680 [Posidoniimonas corsicana]|uniref:Carboxypeptidase regulatory-like domain-containing protein n=1 Tax=Posidoniimonas corsicana TaxID=1938618 RepID=A0A5C5VB94_9BACT|nr:hypothetical protein [Posidoniimonas corsicana]TWT35280.1 hypothetical protein KOR34_01680 [Posidoniimonas corsicana]
MTTHTALVISLLAGTFAVGCRPDDALSVVSGVVTVDGQPAERGAISIIPLQDDSRRAGVEIQAGRYELRAPRGPAKVVIRVPRVIGQAPSNDPNRAPRPIMEESLPARFNSNSELEIDVQPGASVHNFDLTSV